MDRQLGITSLFLAGMTALNPLFADSLCQQSEQVLFSCSTTHDKIISLCASDSKDNGNTGIMYRFGNQNHVELAYPASMQPAKQAFRGRAQMFSGGGGIYLRFNNNDFDYVIYDGTGKGWQMHGVVVLKNKKFVTYLACHNKPIAEISPQMLETLQVPSDSDDAEFFPGDIPSQLISNQ